MNMEFHKMKYLEQIADKYGDQTVKDFRRIIERDEKFIRESYAESTDWIKSRELVEMILHDSVFILGLLIYVASTLNKVDSIQKMNERSKGFLFQQPYLISTILEDLILLENQVPYALLENLFEPLSLKLETNETFRSITLRAFKLQGKIREEVNFLHFTDLFRRVRVETLGLTEEQIELRPPLPKMYSACKLDSRAVDFEVVDDENELSLVIKFEDRNLKMPCFIAEGNNERMLRNLIALEQCHYPSTSFICNYVAFLDSLIQTEKDVDLLVKKGVVKNLLVHKGLAAEMVRKLSVGLLDFGSYYYPIAKAVKNHCENRLNRSFITLRSQTRYVTLKIGGLLLILFTVIQTVASVIQVIHGS